MTNLAFSGSVRPRAKLRFARRIIEPDSDPSSPRLVLEQSLVPREYVLRDGLPYAPDIHVTSNAYISADGIYDDFSTYPWNNIFGQRAHSRFIALSDFWDDGGSRWSPFYTQGIDYWFEWSGTIVPLFENIEYFIGKRVFQFDSIRIPYGAALNSSFNGGIDDAQDFMIAMAGVINSSEDASLIRIGSTPSTAVEVTVNDVLTVTNQYGEGILKTIAHPSAMVPFYLVLIVNSTTTELRVATGTSRALTIKIPSVQTVRSMDVNIGEDLGSSKTLDMNLFEVSIFPFSYGGDISPEEIIESMADVYGSAT